MYAEALNGKVYHYRDKNGLECDAVVHLRDGRYGLVEVKLGGEDKIRDGADALKDLAGKIDTSRMREPSLTIVELRRDSTELMRASLCARCSVAS